MAVNDNQSRILWKIIMLISVMATMATTIYVAIWMKQFIDDRNLNGVPSSNPLHSDQNSDQAEFDSFGRHLEPLWRAFLIANLVAIMIFSLYLPLAIYWKQYYVILAYIAFMFNEMILSVGSEYLAVPYRFATLIYLIGAVMAHGYCHQFRLMILEEMNVIKQFNRE
ncbi:hypothetical protein DERP_008357 [Dermatophagoides pteronyssinus]|uniref:Uncharacterized protein n=1 Tax=Dermatophagoides pteronyssinus TaxID=6956 RepID=A0ABQ8IVC6_DERPT|nr:hypothetical protein DERP_008357 [Dermatophagoides pteronyssinus]